MPKKKIVPKPKTPAKIEEPPPAKGTILSRSNGIPFVLIAIIMPLVWITASVLSAYTCKHFYWL